jgi:hypothetical protein
MSALEIIGLVVGIIVFAGSLGYVFSNGKGNPTEIETLPEYTPQEMANIRAAEEAYKKSVNVDMDIQVIEPEVVSKVQAKSVDTVLDKTPKPEFPIDKPKPKKKYPRKKKPAKVQE